MEYHQFPDSSRTVTLRGRQFGKTYAKASAPKDSVLSGGVSRIELVSNK